MEPKAGWLPRKDLVIGLLFALLCFLVYRSAKFGGTMDTYLHIPIASTIYQGKGMAIERWRETPEFKPLFQMNFWMTERKGHIYSFFPFGSSLLAIPYVAAMGADSIQAQGFDHFAAQQNLASILTAISAFLIYLTLGKIARKKRNALGASVAVALGSPLYSTAAVGIWPHTGGLVCIGFALYTLVSSLQQKNPWSPVNFLVSGLLMGIACAIRPTNAVFVGAILLYLVWLKHRRDLALFAFGLAITMGWALYLSHANYGTWLPPYIGEQQLQSPIPEALAAYVISPGRGLLVFLPLSIFSIFSVPVLWRSASGLLSHRTKWGLLLLLCAGVVLTNYVVFCSWGGWWGGWSYGPRFWCESLPFLAILSLVGYERITLNSLWARQDPGRPILHTAIGAMIVWSLWIHATGANFSSTMLWNRNQPDTGLSSERIWDWQNPQWMAPYR